ncbi:hypothetical protein [Chryseobacterium aureum]|uniref:hypothetical protein n=1 Tax=Chryseobacterium aureum TaxID=2497456 RepID=UPI000F890C39|nr:hypothetical protein [Chryseobacterium aureum]
MEKEENKNMVLNNELIQAYKQMLSNPKDYNLPFKSIDEIFDPSDNAIAKHSVFEKYQSLIQRDIPKVVFYIIMDGLFVQRKADDGNLGWLLTFNV